MPAYLPVRGHIVRVKSEMLQLHKVHRIHPELQHPVQYPVVPLKGIYHLELRDPAVPGFPVVVPVLAAFTAELLVRPSILDLIPAFKAGNRLVFFFRVISHGIVFGLPKCAQSPTLMQINVAESSSFRKTFSLFCNPHTKMYVFSLFYTVPYRSAFRKNKFSCPASDLQMNCHPYKKIMFSKEKEKSCTKNRNTCIFREISRIIC